METMTIQFDKHNAALQQLMQLFVTMGGQILEQKSDAEDYDPEIVAKVKRGREDFLKGNCMTIKAEEVWN
jgi:hypothetical protein